ncbi:MAG: tRNA-guanine transglycosylase, partial [Candidatus Micrarchaeia archaeon]
ENARHGTLFTWNGKISIDKKEYKQDFSPIEEGCGCYTCRHYTKAYLHHLIKTDEQLGFRLRIYHNMHFMQRLMDKIRESIAAGTFSKLEKQITSAYSKGCDPEELTQGRASNRIRVLK